MRRGEANLAPDRFGLLLPRTATFMTYRGRFAPSPTGPLHFGSLVAATGSYLQARQQQGEWSVRIEDLDPPRTVPGAANTILRTLEVFGLQWDGAVVYQSQRNADYEHALQQLIAAGTAYPCSCSRSELLALQDSPREGDELRYPGRCRTGPLRPGGPYAWRFRVPDAPISFTDLAQGHSEHCLPDSIGDFVIKRRDGLFAYQLAVVVDDAAQGITEVVRGADLLSNTPRQIALQQALRLPTPRYMHLPIIVDANGQKLSKSQDAPSITAPHAASTLFLALQHLQQMPPASLQGAPVAELWQWAIAHWNPAAFAGLMQIALSPNAIQ